ncbi:MAG TPA: choice-of-anchor Q domain-containing protein [Phycisphaerae bacterium]|nr:choice-of-anchor Q domain-containing protein [Phycisphaerae bacterium]HNU43753.1 choice-of-anchor Q domain-containing protein [Phycisphaerae bacterium]
MQIHHGDGYATTWGNSRANFYTDFDAYPTSYQDGMLRRRGAYGYSTYQSDFLARRAVATDVTIELHAVQVSGATYQIRAKVCLESTGTAKTMRVYIVQLLDHWPASPTYHRNGFKQAATTQDIALTPGQCQEVVRTMTFDSTSWANPSNIVLTAWAQEPQSSSPPEDRAQIYQGAILHWPFMVDCNSNGIDDPCDIDCGASGGVCDVTGCGQSEDCNLNVVPDECDLAQGTSWDDNHNGVPDECEVTRYYVKASASGNGHGTSWANAYRSLKAALDHASQPYSPVTEVWVAEGTYKPAGAGGDRAATFTLGSGAAVYGGFTGVETDVSQRDPVRHVTILSGDLNGDDGPGFTNISDNSHHVVTASGTDATALLDGFVIRGGNPTGATTINGGGILNVGGHAIFRNCRILNNSGNQGSGMYNTTSAGPTLINCTFSGNSAAVGTLAVVSSSTLTLIHGTLAGNTAMVGAGLFLAGSTSVATATSCVLWGNTDNSGSGQSSQVYISSGAVVINYSCVQGWTGSLGGTGNTGANPLLIDIDGPDNLPGTLDDNLRLSVGSSGIDTGDPTFVPDVEDRDLDGHARELCGRVDMGAYEFGIGDYDCDIDVDLADVAALQNCFTGTAGGPYAAGCEALDFNYDGLVDATDFAEFASLLVGP